MIALGKHMTIEIYECDKHLINDVEKLEASCLKVIKDSGATVVSQNFQRFEPQGISGFVVISESHFSIHTWPEHSYAAVDFFTCGASIDFEKAIESMKEVFKTDLVIVSADLARGIVGNNGVEKHIPVFETNNHIYSYSWKEKFQKSQAWGLLSSVDIYNCNTDKIRDDNFIKNYVTDLCDHIEMKKFGETVVVNFGEDERVSGFSMTQLIETSLISGHFANKSNTAYIDIFSCKFYEPRQAAEFTMNYFSGEHYQLQVSLRQ